MQSIANKVLNRIYGHGRGWAFSPKDFIDCGERSAIDISLKRLEEKGTIRKVLRGIYYYPPFSKLLNSPLSPDPDQVAHAIARTHGWSISPSGETALNLLGISTQVPSKYIYFSDGPSKDYFWETGRISFIKRAIKETSALSPSSALLVQAIKALGETNIDSVVIKKLRNRLSDKNIKTALSEAQYVTGWVYEVIKKIGEKEKHNG